MTIENQKTPMAETPASTACSTTAKQDNASQPSKADALNVEIKKLWSKLTDEEVKFQETQPDQFFAKIKEKYGADKEETLKRLTAIKAACGSCSTEKAA